jgi:hypothetical protein
MKSPIINIASIELKPTPTVMEPTGAAAERFGARMGFISNLVGGKQLGYNITAILKGKRAFPFHNLKAAHNDVCRQGGGQLYYWEGEWMDCHILQLLQSL